LQPVLPELTSDLKLTIELVGHARACRVALVEPVIPHIVVDAKAEFEASDQPLSERVVDLESNVAIEDTGYAGDGRFSDCCPPDHLDGRKRACGVYERGVADQATDIFQPRILVDTARIPDCSLAREQPAELEFRTDLPVRPFELR